MKKRYLNAPMIGITLFAGLATYFANAVEPLSESAMGDVSAESGDILNVMGATASGQDVSDQVEASDGQLTTAATSAQATVAYIENDQSLEPRADTSQTPTDIDHKETVSTFKISERSDGQLGASTISYDEKDHNISASFNEETLTINQSVQVQQVQIHQVRHAPSAPVRGDYSIMNIQVTGSTSITNH